MKLQQIVYSVTLQTSDSKKAIDFLNVVDYLVVRQIENGPLFGRGEFTFVVQAGIYVTKCKYMFGFLFFLIWGKATSYHI